MKKNKILGLAIITIGFLLFFNTAFMEVNTQNPIINALCFIGFLGSTLAAIFISNNEPNKTT